MNDELAAQLGGVLERHPYPYPGTRDAGEGQSSARADGEDTLRTESETLLWGRYRAHGPLAGHVEDLRSGRG